MRSPLEKTYPFGYKFGDKTWYSSFHLGVDLIAPRGTRVVAPEDGKIVYWGIGAEGGNTVWLRGAGGLTHRFLHLDTIAAKTGQIVSEDDLIGTVGNTGARSKGYHLHWDIWTFGGNVNPNKKSGFIDPLKWLGDNVIVMDKPLAEKLIREVVYGYPAGGALNRQTDPAVDDKPAFDSRVKRLMAASDWSRDLANQVEEAINSPEFKQIRLKVQ